MLVNGFYYFNSCVSDSDCQSILDLSEGKFSDSIVNIKHSISDEERTKGFKNEYASDDAARKSEVFFSSDQFLYDTIWPFMQEANEKAGWNYEITACEPVQITKYDNLDYYHWHMDGNGCHMSKYNNPKNKWLDGKVRKLSMSLILNDDFEGGQLQIASLKSSNDKYHVTEYTPPYRGPGSIIVFPSFLMHRVKPVTKGTRYSLVAWFVGPSFK